MADPTGARRERLIALVARSFHEVYEELAPTHGWKTQERSQVPWNDVPEGNRKLMVATVDRLIDDGVIELGPALTRPLPAITNASER